MTAYEQLRNQLRLNPRRWLVTGAAGFIGSHLVENLLSLKQDVVGLDNFSTGHDRNLQEVKAAVGSDWQRFQLIRGDIAEYADCARACENIDLVLHHAALGSVPGSIASPLESNRSNVNGFVNMLEAARKAGVQRFVYASSSAVYGDDPELPKVEHRIGEALSPYAATKRMDEIYAGVFGRCYGIQAIGLRYFNVFGPRQDPEGAYAAVIPKWIAALIKGEAVRINGDGETSRDFCYINNVVQANLLAATATGAEVVNQVFNIAHGGRTTLNELCVLLQESLRRLKPSLHQQTPLYQDFRPGDVRHSLASIEKARSRLGFEPSITLQAGLDQAMHWYSAHV
jgi:UDP-N-acetylglucosamine/UDP-N-acetylgalactosamine 4-epimerase